MSWLNRKMSERAARPNVRLHVESLEDRCLLSQSGSAWRTLLGRPPGHGSHSDSSAHREVAASAAARPAGNPRAAATQQLPDLIVWASAENEYLYGWHIDTDEPTEPGRRLLRLTNAVANIGAGPLELNGGPTNPDGTQVVFQRIYNSDNSTTDREAGTFTYHPEHGHIHFDDYAEYNLRAVTADDGVGDVIATGAKISFCLLDVDTYDSHLPGHPRNGHYDSCGTSQGISVGWADVYDSSLADQWIDITDVPDGTYWLESVVDRNNRLLESDETNNVARIKITLGPPPPDDFPNTFDAATPILLATHGTTTQTGEIGESRDVDMFSFAANKKGKLTITQSSAGGLDSYLIVYDANQQEIARDDDSAGHLNSRVRVHVQPGQTYFVQAGGFESDTGPYQLTFARGHVRNVPQLRSSRRIELKNLPSLAFPLNPLD